MPTAIVPGGIYRRSDDGPIDIFAKGQDGSFFGRYPHVKSEHVAVSEILAV